MDSATLTQVLVFGGILLILLLIILYLTFFFKPGKQLNVEARLYQNETSGAMNVSLEIKNIGKKGMKIVHPFVKFRKGRYSRLFQVKPDRVNSTFPKIIKPGEEYDCIIEITPYVRLLSKRSFSPSSMKIMVKDTVGVKFQSESVLLS